VLRVHHLRLFRQNPEEGGVKKLDVLDDPLGGHVVREIELLGEFQLVALEVRNRFGAADELLQNCSVSFALWTRSDIPMMAISPQRASVGSAALSGFSEGRIGWVRKR
jgi:hypothetical protein